VSKLITVIGAGIVGIATASYLRRDGHLVTLVDMRLPGEYCSFGNAGILSPGSCVPLGLPGVLAKVPGYLSDPLGPLAIRLGYLPKALPWFMRFIAASRPARIEKIADALRSLLRQTFDAYLPLTDNANCSDLVRQSGYVVAYEREQSYRNDALPWRLRRERSVKIEMLDRADIARMMPQLAGDFALGLFLPEQGYVANPGRLAKVLAEQFVKDGGRIEQCKVLDIEIGPHGPKTLVTDAGNMPMETLVICAGAHSHEFSAKLGDVVPLEAERGYHVTYPDSKISLPVPIFFPEHKFFVTPMEMGLRIAGQSEFAGIDAKPNYRRADVLAQQMQRFFPGIRDSGATRWMGPRPSIPDSLPVIGQASKFSNVWYAFGHGHIGLCGGAPTGRAIADLIAGREPRMDLAPFGVSRF
jgi:D-amino-acid dehydrogenase